MRDSARVAPEWWGVQGSCTHDVVLTRNGGGAASLRRLPPALRVALGLCAAP